MAREPRHTQAELLRPGASPLLGVGLRPVRDGLGFAQSVVGVVDELQALAERVVTLPRLLLLFRHTALPFGLFEDASKGCHPGSVGRKNEVCGFTLTRSDESLALPGVLTLGWDPWSKNGTMTIQSESTAVFTSAAGSVRFHRTELTKPPLLCA